MAYAPTQLSFTQNSPLQQVGIPLVSASTTSGVAMAFGSSLFLNRMYIPGPMNLSECDMALSMAMATAASSTGSYGSFARTLVVYTFSNSTKLASLYSTSQGVTFVGTSVTSGALTNFSNIVPGWTQAGGVIFPMTFASSELAPGDYVFGNLMSFSGSANASISIFGANNNVPAAAQTVTTQATSAVSLATGSAAMTVGTGTISVSSYGAAFLALSTAGDFTAFTISASSSLASSFNSALSVSVTGASVSESFSLIGASANSNIVSSVSMKSSAVTLNTSTVAVTMGTGAAANSTISANTNSVPAFNYLGSQVSTLSVPGIFMNGIYSTGAVPAAITLTATASLTTVGSVAAAQPYFALVGA